MAERALGIGKYDEHRPDHRAAELAPQLAERQADSEHAAADRRRRSARRCSDAHATPSRRATDAAERFAEGDPSMGIHEVMIATEKANIAVRYATTLKNKALEAYRELMNTQV